MQNIIVVTLGDDMSFASVQELAHAIEMWRGVSKVEFKDSTAQQCLHTDPPTARSFSATCPKCGTFIGVDFANTAASKTNR